MNHWDTAAVAVSLFDLLFVGHLLGDFILQNHYIATQKSQNTLVCLFHVLIYSMAVTILSGQWVLWFYVIVFVPHFLIDRFGLAKRFMHIFGQEEFAKEPLAPWSIIVIDQVLHVTCLLVTALYWQNQMGVTNV